MGKSEARGAAVKRAASPTKTTTDESIKEETGGAAKKSKGEAKGGDIIPVLGLPAGGPPAASQGREVAAGAAPLLPPVFDENDDADVVANMRGVVPYVTSMVQDMLQSRDEFKCQFVDQDPRKHQPLEVLAVSSMSKSGTMTSYKAPWTTTMARNALETTGMVEATINALWLDPHPAGSGEWQIIAGEQLCWKDVREAARKHFSEGAFQTTRAASQGVARIMFPTAVNVHVDKVEQACHDWFPSTLRVMSGHVYLYGLYLGMCEAFQKNQWQLLGSLWQCCLTTTVCCRHGLSISEQAVLTISESEVAKRKAELMCDSFIGFAHKALLVMKDQAASPTR